MNLGTLFKRAVPTIITVMTITGAILYIYHNYTERSWGDAFSLGQLLVELILFPLAIVSFIFAAQQFVASQELPKPQLYFEPSEGNFSHTIKLTRTARDISVSTPAIIIRNEGKSITSWYLVVLNISSDTYLDQPPQRHQLNVQPHVHDPHWETISIASGQQWRFTSQGEYALYPEYTQRLCSISFTYTGGKKYPANCKIPYIIFSDRGKKVSGELTIEFIDIE
jgi:hypothetical protein